MRFPDYDDFDIGLEVGPLELIVDEHRVRSYAYAVDDFNAWYLVSSPFGGPIAPPTLLTTDDLTSDDPALSHLQTVTNPSALAARLELRSFAPISVGQHVLLRAKHVDKHVRRGRGYVVRSFDVLDPDSGEVLTASRLTEMIGLVPDLSEYPETPQPDDGRRIIPRESSLPTASRATGKVPVNSPLRTLTKVVRRKQMFAFSGRPGWWTNIHTDPEFARSLGLPNAIAQGAMTTGYLAQMCVDFFGKSWITNGFVSVAFIRPVSVDDRLVVNGLVSEHIDEGEGHRIQVDLWCENQDGELVTIGRASAPVA